MLTGVWGGAFEELQTCSVLSSCCSAAVYTVTVVARLDFSRSPWNWKEGMKLRQVKNIITLTAFFAKIQPFFLNNYTSNCCKSFISNTQVYLRVLPVVSLLLWSRFLNVLPPPFQGSDFSMHLSALHEGFFFFPHVQLLPNQKVKYI